MAIIPRIHDTVGPRAVRGEFLSPRGRILSSWRVDHGGSVSLNVSLPIGVQAVTILVPYPMFDGMAVPGVIKEHGALIWDGQASVGKHAGIAHAVAREDGVAFVASNGDYAFESLRAALPESRDDPS